MTKPYKELTLVELKCERMRLCYILGNHPKPNTYRQTKASLNRIDDLIAKKVKETLK